MIEVPEILKDFMLCEFEDSSIQWNYIKQDNECVTVELSLMDKAVQVDFYCNDENEKVEIYLDSECYKEIIPKDYSVVYLYMQIAELFV